MRTDVKVGVAGGALILIVAVAYYGAKRNEVTLADGDTGVSSPLDELLGHAQAEDKKPTPKPVTSKQPSKPAARKSTTPGKKPQGVNAQRQGTQKQPQKQTRDKTRTASRNNPNVPRSSNQKRGSAAQRAKSQDKRSGPAAAEEKTPGGTALASGTSPPQSRRAKRVPPQFKPAQQGARSDSSVATEALRQRPRAGGQSVPSRDALTQNARNTRNTTEASSALERLRARETTAPRKEQRDGQASRRQGRTASDNAGSRTSAQLAAARIHTVESGDTFAAIAVRYYGSEKHTAHLLAANPGVDPRRLQLGATLQVPHLNTGSTQREPRREAPRSSKRRAASGIYVVQEGDTFYGIASKVLGSGNRWREIYELNRDIIGSDPNQLSVGQELNVPKS